MSNCEQYLLCTVRAYGAHPYSFARLRSLVYSFYHAYSRTLPWRYTRDPYHIFVSEMMLQQTGVARVAEKFHLFLDAFPDWHTLAKAPVKDLLIAWQGLGYNRRALYLQKSAQKVLDDFQGSLPRCPDALQSLPGIGPATAASISAFAFNIPTVFLETNIRTVFIHWFFPCHTKVDDSLLLPLAADVLDCHNPRKWYNALMDYGTWLKARVPNPTRRSAQYQKQSPFEGSLRQLRGRILAQLTKQSSYTIENLARDIDSTDECTYSLVQQLAKEGFLVLKDKEITIH